MNYSKTIIWEAIAWKGRERCQIAYLDNRYIVKSELNGRLEKTSFNLQYKLEINAGWNIESVHIDSMQNTKKLVNLGKDAKSRWINEQSEPLIEFSNCTDIDISLSPFTNTLPIRRLTFDRQSREAITVIYIDLPSGEIKPMKQWYTKLKNRRYKYEDETGYTNTITVDENGFVIDYPNLFERKSEEIGSNKVA